MKVSRVVAGLVGGVATACITFTDVPSKRVVDQEAEIEGGPIHFVDGAGAPVPDDVLPGDPHDVVSVDPPHGPFAGGTLAVVRGAGFSSNARVWFGTSEAAPPDLVALDPGRLQLVVPPGAPGDVDVSAQNGNDKSTRRSLPAGFHYDAFYAEPATGPTSGGTVVTLFGSGTEWTKATNVTIDRKPCELVELRSPKGKPQELECRAPPGTPGAKAISAKTDDEAIEVADAFTYGDTEDGFRGGLSGKALDGDLRVIALNADTGAAIPGAAVIVGAKIDTAVVATTDAKGVAIVHGTLGPKRTVTIAAKCHQPTTFVDVPVDTVTAYLDTMLSPECASFNQIPITGGTSREPAQVKGELVWDGAVEFKRALWNNVPVAAKGLRRAAYLFPLAADPDDAFRLPDASKAVTPESDGSIGYDFDVSVSGGHTLYALAGIETTDDSPRRFTAFAMGLVRGVATAPGKTKIDVIVKMDNPLDRAVSLEVEGPKPTLRGPDRVAAYLAVRIGGEGYALLPEGSRTSLLPSTGPLSFVGVPPLVGSLAGAAYAATATASTGEAETVPRAAIARFLTTSESDAVVLDGFVEVPRLVTPAPNGAFDGTRLAIDAVPGGSSVELTLVEIESGSGLVTWRVVAPGAPKSIALPSLSGFSELGLRHGTLRVRVVRAHLEAFDYGSLRYRHLRKRSWDAWAEDASDAHF